jgi:hypothetical protein
VVGNKEVTDISGDNKGTDSKFQPGLMLTGI